MRNPQTDQVKTGDETLLMDMFTPKYTPPQKNKKTWLNWFS